MARVRIESADVPLRVVVIQSDGTRDEWISQPGDDVLDLDISDGAQVRVVERFEQPEAPDTTNAVQLGA